MASKSSDGSTKITISGNTTFSGNTAPMYGGAIYCESVMELDKVNFDSNTAGKYGGAVFVSPNGDMKMENTTKFTGNSSTRGGAIYNYGKLTLSDVTVSGNTATEYGGGILSEGTLNMGGAVVVKDNCGKTEDISSNLYLKEGKIIAVTGSLKNSSVSLNMEIWGLFTSGYKKNNGDTDPATFFVADADARFYCAVLSGDEAALSLKPVITVDNDKDLRDAIALDFAKINIKQTADIVLSNSTLEIPGNKTVTIDLGGHTLDRGLKAREWNTGGQVITVRKDATLNLSKGTLTGGWGGNSGGLCNEGGTANLTDVTITGCTGDDRGGGISNQGTLTMTGGAISGNTSNDAMDSKGGGGIMNYKDATATLTGVSITGNKTAKYSGGIFNSGTMTIDGCTITGNTASREGGAIWQEGALNMQGKNTITGNKSADGATDNVYLNNGSVITVTGSLEGSAIGILLTNNTGTFTSGYKKNNDGVDPATIFTADKDIFFDVALAGDEAALNVQPLITVDNFADLREAVRFDGANVQLAGDINSSDLLAIENDKTVTIDMNGKMLNRGLTSLATGHGQVVVVAEGSTLKLSNGTLTGGFGGDGGGLENKGTATLTNVNITGNHANDRGGGISNQGTLTMTGGSITNNISNDNVATSGGGAIYTYSGSNTTLSGVTITGNEAKIAGGGVNSFGTLTIDGCTMTGNTSKNGGAIWTAGGSTLNMQGKNTITDNTAKGKTHNIYLSNNVVITVTGSLEGSSIGLTMQTPGIFTSGYSTYNKDVIPVAYFKSDDTNYTVILNNNEVSLKDNIGSSINGVDSDVNSSAENAYYTIGGRKLHGRPTVKGVYIKGGRKVLVP